MIACPRCGIAYAVAPARFGLRSRIVQCSGCHYRWTQAPEGALPPVAERSSAGASSGVPVGRLEPEAWPEAVDDADSAGSPGDGSADGALPAIAAPPVVAETAADEAAAGLAADADAGAPPLAEDMAPDDQQPAAGADATAAGDLPPEPPAQPDALSLPSSTAPVAAPAPAAAGGRRSPFRLPRLPGGSVAAAALSAGTTVLILAALLILLRAPILAALPASAGFYGMFGLLPAVAGAGLEIRDVAARRPGNGGADVLIVAGTIAGIAASPVALPVLRATLYDDAGEPVAAADRTGESAALAEGETMGFEIRIADPPADARRVGVAFIPRPDPPDR